MTMMKTLAAMTMWTLAAKVRAKSQRHWPACRTGDYLDRVRRILCRRRFDCINILFNIYQMTQPVVYIAPGQPGAELNALRGNPAGSVGFGVVALLVSGFIIFGAIQMKNGKMYGVSMAAAILSIIPCCSPCFCFGIPFGIWALIVLLDQNVKSSFTS